jgi:hypothetical protein
MGHRAVELSGSFEGHPCRGVAQQGRGHGGHEPVRDAAVDDGVVDVAHDDHVGRRVGHVHGPVRRDTLRLERRQRHGVPAGGQRHVPQDRAQVALAVGPEHLRAGTQVDPHRSARHLHGQELRQVRPQGRPRRDRRRLRGDRGGPDEHAPAHLDPPVGAEAREHLHPHRPPEPQHQPHDGPLQQVLRAQDQASDHGRTPTTADRA